MSMTEFSIEYKRVGNGRIEERCLVSIKASLYVNLPTGRSNRAIFLAAREKAPSALVADVLNDTFRYLYYGHFCGEGIDLDHEFPFRDTIPEARNFGAGIHRSQKTEAVGSALYLLLSTRAAEESKAVLGGIVWAMSRHSKYGGSKEQPVVPVIDSRKAS